MLEQTEAFRRHFVAHNEQDQSVMAEGENRTVSSGNPAELSIIDNIRKRPAMYVGSVDFFGFINWLVCPYRLCLEHGASSVALNLDSEDEICLRSDATVAIEFSADGLIIPFEFDYPDEPQIDGPVLNALAHWLEVDSVCGGQRWQLRFEQGKCVSQKRSTTTAEDGIELRFAPDPEILKCTSVSPANVDSYLARIQHLYPGVEFSATVGGATRRYQSRGMIDLFAQVSQPFQYLHQPIHVQAQQDDLQLDLVLAFHSWNRHHIWSFVNQGRAADGGTHEDGLLDAIGELSRLFNEKVETGALAVMAIQYPKVMFEGCIKGKVRNQELRSRVKELVLAGVEDWIVEHPQEMTHLRNMERFQFADIW